MSTPAAAAPARAVSAGAGKVMPRYRDAYRVANTIVGIGSTLKIVGMIGAGLMALIGLAGGSSFGFMGVLAAVLAAGFWFALFFVFGIVVSAQGQVLQAGLDTAVNTSPFLSNEEKIEIIN
jgi:hypothetical protein